MQDRTDDEIFREALTDWQAVIAGMWDAVGKSLVNPGEQARFAQYVRQLESIPLGLLQLACDRAVKEQGKYMTVPPIGAVWESLRKELHNPYDLDQAIGQWKEEKWQNAVYLFQQNS